MRNKSTRQSETIDAFIADYAPLVESIRDGDGVTMSAVFAVRRHISMTHKKIEISYEFPFFQMVIPSTLA